jgi:RimJ/RimL family protein N-acetyltransferase
MNTEFVNDACPFLPEVDRRWTSREILSHGAQRGAAFHFDSLCYAQSQWRTGFPAQAILQINRSFACHLSTDQLRWPLAYHAMAWLMNERPAGQFLGNPTRHFQHLATRMVQPHKELRTWRAWACWYLARHLLPEAEFPPDTHQIRHETLALPTHGDILSALESLSPADDAAQWMQAQATFQVPSPRLQQHPELQFEELPTERLGEITALARAIWPEVYAELLTPAQISYMLDWMYAPATLANDVLQKGANYSLIHARGECVGYIGFNPEGSALTLQKLYLKPQLLGQGMGARALQGVVTQAQLRGLQSIQLRVNKQNHRAIRAYLRQGFRFEEDIIVDIGGGFVMDDHVMIRSLV